MVVDFGKTSNIVGIDIVRASIIMDLTELELGKLPLDKQKIRA